ncbi:uncharacterized protein LOC126856432 [Cataglyphis hispanica]|uniref:uncharacterized protein LOC126856432 n=1 Tax=Cataglyphis hispanica TaxID=1086592 RepID=UPI0021801EC4|nr:uncharacterized protein LOC126856432 [Cataglyphis hispanica]
MIAHTNSVKTANSRVRRVSGSSQLETAELCLSPGSALISNTQCSTGCNIKFSTKSYVPLRRGYRSLILRFFLSATQLVLTPVDRFARRIAPFVLITSTRKPRLPTAALVRERASVSLDHRHRRPDAFTDRESTAKLQSEYVCTRFIRSLTLFLVSSSLCLLSSLPLLPLSLSLSLSFSTGKVDLGGGRSYYLVFSLSTNRDCFLPVKPSTYPLDVDAATSTLLFLRSTIILLSLSCFRLLLFSRSTLRNRVSCSSKCFVRFRSLHLSYRIHHASREKEREKNRSVDWSRFSRPSSLADTRPKIRRSVCLSLCDCEGGARTLARIHIQRGRERERERERKRGTYTRTDGTDGRHARTYVTHVRSHAPTHARTHTRTHATHAVLLRYGKVYGALHFFLQPAVCLCNMRAHLPTQR